MRSLFMVNQCHTSTFLNPDKVMSICPRPNSGTNIYMEGESLIITGESIDVVVSRFQSAIGSSKTYQGLINKIERESK
jgi:hypothetical protein